MSQAPPPYPGDEKGGSYPPPPNPSYPPQYGPPPAQGFVPPPAQGFVPPPAQGYGPPPAQGYGPPPPGAWGPPPQGYPVPQHGYVPPHGQYGQSTVVVTQPTMTVIQQFREAPVHTKCPHCQAEIVTATHYETGTLTWIICVVLCLVGCDFGCCLIPFCVDGCKDVLHSCPNCRQTISRYSRM